MATLVNFVILLVLWFLSLIITAKFNIKKFNDTFIKVISQQLKSLILILIFFLCSYNLFTNGFKEEFSFISILLIFSMLDIFILILILLFKTDKLNDPIFRKNEKSDQVQLEPKKVTQDLREIESILKNGIRKLFIAPELIPLFSNKNINYLPLDGKVNKSQSIFELSSNKKEQYQFLFIDRDLNNFTNLNKSLKAIYNSLGCYGLLLIRYIQLEDRPIYQNLTSNMFLKIFVFPFYFIVTRIAPKLPIFEKIYFILSGKKYLTISKAECWGRLHYSGFEVINEMKIDSVTYVLTQKVWTPSLDKNPSYYPIVRLKRVCYNNKIGLIYKIRTMHPYSEYIQKKVFEMSSLSKIGKFNDDFRITSWGKFLRKFYLDEIIQLLNYIKGDIKLVGIRAMSEHYFSLYSPQYQELYYKVKPGFFSPIPECEINTFEEGAKVEQEYLIKFLQSPVKTDVKYFFRILSQIIFKKRFSS